MFLVFLIIYFFVGSDYYNCKKKFLIQNFDDVVGSML